MSLNYHRTIYACLKTKCLKTVDLAQEQVELARPTPRFV